MKLRPLAFDAARALPLYPWRVAAVAAGTLLLGWFISDLLLMLGLLALLVVFAWWLRREVLPLGTRGTVRRRFDREQRAGGVASALDVWQRSSRTALRGEAYYLRPSLRGTPRRKIDPNAVGILLARNGLRLPLSWRFQECWSGVRDVVLYVGGPGTNKTISLAEHGITAPGALITTSSRPDLAKWIHRARKDRPVHIFNPSGKGDLTSTVRWSVLVGCDDYETAQRRAIDMLPERRNDDNKDWYEKAETLLALLLHGCALGGYRGMHMLRWLSALNRDRGYESVEVEREIMRALDRNHDADSKILLLRAWMAEPEKTKGSVGSFVGKALAWLASETARAIGDAPLNEVNLDIERLIENRETLHAIGHRKAGGPMTSLISALVAELMFQARHTAACMPGGRLDPPLTLLLDEAAVAVRLPLEEWTADAGGDGIHMIISVQSLAQLELCWGRAGAETIKGNTGAMVVFGGGWNASDLSDISTLCGEYLADVVHPQLRDAHKEPGAQRGELRWVPVMSPSQLSTMLPGQAVVLKRGLGGAFVGRTPTVLDRKAWTPEVIEPASVIQGTVIEIFDSTDTEDAA